MMFKTKHIILILISIILISLFIFPSVGNNCQITIIESSDIHGAIIPGKIRYKSFIRTIKREIKRSGGRKNILLIDCGDLFQGSLATAKSKGKVMINLLNSLKYNIFIPGNHDFDYGTNIFVRNIKALQCNILAANLYIKKLANRIQPYKIYNISGRKIAIIGNTSENTKSWLWGNRYKGIEIYPVESTLLKIMPSILSQHPDLIVLAIHEGLSNSKQYRDNIIVRIAKLFPQIDIILGGHTHKIYPGEIVGRDTLYVQPGAYGRFIAEVKVNFIDHNKKIYSKLIQIKPNYNNQRYTNASKSHPFIKKLKTLSNRKGTIEIVKRVAVVMKKISKSDIALFASKILKINKYPSDIEKFIFAILHYEDNIVKLKISGKELKKIIKELFELKRRYKNRIIFYFAGLKMRYGRRFNVKNIKFKGRKIENNKIYSLSITSYMAASGGGKFKFINKYVNSHKSMAVDTETSLRKAIINNFNNYFK